MMEKRHNIHTVTWELGCWYSSDKINFKAKAVFQDKKGYFMIKWSIHQKDNNCKHICTSEQSQNT